MTFNGGQSRSSQSNLIYKDFSDLLNKPLNVLNVYKESKS